MINLHFISDRLHSHLGAKHTSSKLLHIRLRNMETSLTTG